MALSIHFRAASRAASGLKHALRSGTPVSSLPARLAGSNDAPSTQNATANVQEQIIQKNNEYPVMIYSKSWCPFCHTVKDLFHGELKVDAMFAELDELADGATIQDELLNMTGSRTVPQVFIAGEFIGGASETTALHAAGGLLPKLDAAGIPYAK